MSSDNNKTFSYNNIFSLPNVAFSLPVIYSDNCSKLSYDISKTLELNHEDADIRTTDNTPIYNELFTNNLTISKLQSEMLVDMSRYYTIDIKFLKHTQKMLKTYAAKIKEEKDDAFFYKIQSKLADDVYTKWKQICENPSFCEKYSFISWDHAQFVNRNPQILQIIGMYSLISPLLSLCIPIVLLIIPFFILKINGIHLTMTNYVNILTHIASNYALVKLFTDFNSSNTNERVVLVVSAMLFLFSIYQNILSCVNFYNTSKEIYSHLNKLKLYLQQTIVLMHEHNNLISNFSTYTKFSRILSNHINILSELEHNISSDKFVSINSFSQIGKNMEIFYALHNDKCPRRNALAYSFGFNGYIMNIRTLAEHISALRLGKVTYSSNTSSNPFFTQMYYPKFISDSHNNCIVKNNVNFNKNKNIVLSGPNASGKTTLLKSVMINILLAQQFGYGCFDKLTLSPFNNLYCYLNIPDTSGRDSLFQAEARRCKEILENIKEMPSVRHFCIFDELYSGTNPDEAVQSAIAFIKYISELDNVNSILSTHYLELCNKVRKLDFVKNFHMKVKQTDKDKRWSYTYKLSRGISTIKGGIKILNDLEYPTEIISNL